MVARMYGFGVIGLLAVIVILVGVYLVVSNREPKPRREMDVSTRPSLWWADTRSTKNDTATQVSIVRVDQHSGEVLERRVLENIENSGADYAARLDAAQDRAYEAQRKANLGLTRR